jgi:hypothetical protein
MQRFGFALAAANMVGRPRSAERAPAATEDAPPELPPAPASRRPNPLRRAGARLVGIAHRRPLAGARTRDTLTS